MLKGKALSYGDTIGLIGPSGVVRSEDGVQKAAAKARELGFQVKLGQSCFLKYGLFSGSS